MALSNSQYDSIMRIYNQAQLRQKRELDKRREEVYEKIPAVKEINEEITASAVKSARQLLAGDDRSAKGLKRRIADLCEEREVLLSAYGYPADYLELHLTARTAVTQATGTGKNATVSRSGRSAFCTISPISGKS